MITKHYCKSIVRAALLLAVTMCIVGLAPAFSPSAQAYSINDVSGNYVDLGNGWTYGGKIGNDKQSVPWSVVGLVTFTPATGTFHADWIVRLYGETTEIARDGTYTVDTNGHGAMTWISATGLPRRLDFYIVNRGAEIQYIDSDPPSTVYLSVSGTMTRQ